MDRVLTSLCIGGLAVFAFCACQPATVLAQSFSAAPAQKISIDLDTADGNFSYWQHEDLSSLSALKASIRIARMGKHPRSGPYFTVRVGTAAGTYGLRLRPDSPGATRISLQAYYREQKSDVVVSTFKRTIGINERVDVELHWTNDRLAVRIDNERSELRLSGAIRFVGISSSTGELMGDVTLGTMR
jgi:hypothetical protein